MSFTNQSNQLEQYLIDLGAAMNNAIKKVNIPTPTPPPHPWKKNEEKISQRL